MAMVPLSYNVRSARARGTSTLFTVLSIAATVSPNIDPGHTVQALIDGNVAAEGPSTSFALTNIDRGTHALVVQIVDEAGNVLIASPEITFHMLRYSALRKSPRN